MDAGCYINPYTDYGQKHLPRLLEERPKALQT